MNRLILTMIILVVGIQSTQAAVFDYSGSVTGGTGALAVLVPVDSFIDGTIEIDSPDGVGTVTDTASILSINLLMTNPGGGPLFCFTFNSACTFGFGAEVPITSILAVDLTFNANGAPISGAISVLAFSPTFNLNLPIDLDITNGTFLVDGGGLGTSTGVGNFQPVPLPAAAWMLLSALFSISLLKKRSSH